MRLLAFRKRLNISMIRKGDIKDPNVAILNCFFHSSLHGYTLTTSSTFPDSSV